MLNILCDVSSHKTEYIQLILSKILEKLCSNKNLLNLKGITLLKKLCTILPAESVYSTIADILYNFKVTKFIIGTKNLFRI